MLVRYCFIGFNQNLEIVLAKADYQYIFYSGINTAANYKKHIKNAEHLNHSLFINLSAPIAFLTRNNG